MPHEDYVTLAGEGGTPAAATLYLTGPVVPELIEITAPKITDVAEEDDRRVGPSAITLRSFVEGIGQMFLDQGAGLWDARRVWSLEDGRIIPSPRVDTTKTLTCSWEFTGLPPRVPILLAKDPDDNTQYLYVLAGDTLFKLSETDVATTVDGPLANALVGRTLLQFKESGTSNSRLYAFYHKFTSPRANYRYSNDDNFDSWNDGGRVLCDGIVFKDVLMAADDGGQIVFSSTGLSGEWNDTDPNDMEPVVDMGFTPVTFIGVANAPWGTPAVYYMHEGKLYVLLYEMRLYSEIPLQNTIPILGGTIWQGRVVVTDGFQIYEYDPETQKSKNIGLPGERPGLPFSFQYGVTRLFTSGSYLCAVMNQFALGTDSYEVLFYNGRGWHHIFSDYDVTPTITHAFVGAASAFRDVGWTAQPPQVQVLGGAALTGAIGSLYLQLFDLPQYGQPTNDAEDRGYISPTDAYFILPWLRIYGDLDGVLVGALINAYMPAGTTALLRISYRVKRNDAWTGLGDMAAADVPYKFMPFGSADGDSLYGGVPFRQVQFKVAFYAAAAANVTKWPEFFSITPYFVKHTLRKRYAFTIDTAATAANETGGTALQNFSEILKHLLDCINNPLCKLEIPNLTKSRGNIVAIRGAHMDLTRDDESGGSHEVVAPGEINVVFEEVAPRESDGFHTTQLPS